MAEIRSLATLALAGCLGLAPSLLKAANIGRIGPTGGATGASMGAAGAALRAPLANLMTSRITADHGLARDWAVGQAAAALAAQGVQAEAFAGMPPEAALAQVDGAVRAMVRETAAKIAAEKDAAANHDRAIDLMKFRAILGRSLDEETRAVLDEAYEAARSQFAGTVKGEILGKMREIAGRLQSGNFLAETGLLHLGEKTPAAQEAFKALPGAGELDAAQFEQRVRTAYGLKPAVFEAAAFEKKVMPAPALQARKLDVSSLIRQGLESQHDLLDDLRGRREALRRAQSPSFAGPDGAILSYHARDDSPALAGQIRALDEQIGRVYEEIAALEGPIRAKLAENRAKLSELKLQRRAFAEIQSRAAGPRVYPGYDMLPVDSGPSQLETYLRSEGVDLGGAIAQLDEQIAAIEKENASLKASLPRSRFRRWLADLWDAMVKTYAKAGEYSVK